MLILFLYSQVKTNFGHSEAASALTSIMKVVLALEKGKIPPTYGVKKLNPKRKSIYQPLIEIMLKKILNTEQSISTRLI
jgi:3-oxoacyl-(acyl-carrier-protein) synthase